MLKNYFTIALRNLRKRPGYALINAGGLAIGMACCLLIALFVQDEWRFDRYHEKADRIHRIITTLHLEGVDELRLASSLPPLGPALREDFPEVEQAVRIAQFTDQTRVETAEQAFYEPELYYADSSVFAVFSWPLRQGDPATALARPNTVVLTETAARKYFPAGNPLGQTLTVNRTHALTVTGVMRDVPAQAHLRPDFLVSLMSAPDIAGADLDDWGSIGSLYTYVLLPAGYPPERLEASLPPFIDRHVEPEGDEAASSFFELRLQPLTRLHLFGQGLANQPGEPGSVAVVYVFSGIAVLLLIVACINYMNLATARSAARAREVGMRKVLGAYRKQLVGQFLGEAVLLSLLAIPLALALATAALPVFNAMAGKALTMQHGALIGGLVGVALLVGLVAGSYPALFLAGFHPIEVLKGRARRSPKAALFREGLVVVQFVAAIALVAGTLIIAKQMHFVQTKELGFNAEQVVVVPLREEVLRQRAETLKAAFSARSGVLAVASASSTPGKNTAAMASLELKDDPEKQLSLMQIAIDADFIPALGIEVVEGRGFDEARETGEVPAFLVNEAAVRKMGLSDPVGRTMVLHDGQEGPIVGIVSDFHLFSLDEQIQPLLLRHDPGSAAFVVVRIRPERIEATLEALGQAWKAFAPGTTFEYTFVDDDFARQYRDTQQLSAMLRAFAGLTIFVACLGLLGLAAFTAEQRTKEIGVRKVLGASASGIVALLSRDFLRLVALAFVLAAPLAYFAARRWLDDFAYRTDLGPGVFLLAGGLALAVTLVTVAYHAVRAALVDPVESLRYE